MHPYSFQFILCWLKSLFSPIFWIVTRCHSIADAWLGKEKNMVRSVLFGHNITCLCICLDNLFLIIIIFCLIIRLFCCPFLRTYLPRTSRNPCPVFFYILIVFLTLWNTNTRPCSCHRHQTNMMFWLWCIMTTVITPVSKKSTFTLPFFGSCVRRK
ncbi:MAG: hypothetical protein BWX89_00768 [candidate division TA06 bacterium ADurb.Bin131]|uniref:Uncharacterized protein n=1 Tax=candidate division TA06 bacterium ADurb.Bin131 TaxID=1852827 RepID=A0A1V6CAB5_UNCT6|nr:MAG: hypothetical protein BWX89_00768 [candidate division TA06 bacterium ADurb.Bin131]